MRVPRNCPKLERWIQTEKVKHKDYMETIRMLKKTFESQEL